MTKSNLDLLLESDVLVHNDKHMPHPENIYNTLSNIINIKDVKLGKAHKHIVNNDIESTTYDSYMFTTDVEGYNISGVKGIANSAHTSKLGITVHNTANKLQIWGGFEASACLNLCIFNASTVIDNQLLSSLPFLLQNVELIMNNIAKESKNVEETIYNLINTTYDKEQYNQKVGKVYLSGLDTSLVTSSIKAHQEELYKDMPDSDWKLYSTITDKLSDKAPHKIIELTKKVERYFI